MASPPYEAPSHNTDAFNCPNCDAYAQQRWSSLSYNVHLGKGQETPPGWDIARCDKCHKFSLWINGTMVFPPVAAAPLPNPDMPEDIQADYLEAREIQGRSPRGASALLRLCVQKLCKELGQPGKNINDDIAALVKGGLPVKVQQSLDVVRVVGNNGVHPGQIDLNDDPAIAGALFGLVNVIVEVMISQPKLIESLYDGLPDTSKDAINKRDQQP